MSAHKNIPKKTRIKVYEKYGGRCAYCGCKLEYNDYKRDMSEEEMYDFSNLMPSCRMCNLYKGAFDLETFRRALETTLLANAVKPFQFRLAEKYGLVKQHPHKITFFFETAPKGRQGKNQLV